MTNRKSIFPLQPTGVGSKSGGVPMSHVPADAAAVPAASSLVESSPVLVLPELLVLVLPELLVLVPWSPVLVLPEALVTGCDPPPVKPVSVLSRAQAGQLKSHDDYDAWQRWRAAAQHRAMVSQPAAPG
jgi:hypothetical protein